jgi:hypothetical protein
MHDSWINRCDTNHGTSKEDKRRRALLILTPKIQQLYAKQDQTAPSDGYLFETPIDDLLQLPSHTLERWLHTAKQRITASIKRQRNFTRQHSQPIQSFFQLVIPSTIPQRQVHENNHINHPAQHIRENQLIRVPLRYSTRSISEYFWPTTQHPNHDPFIHIPHNDYRPP